MPTFEFETDGRKFQIEASDANAATAAWGTASKNLPPAPSTGGDIRRGVARGVMQDVIGGVSAVTPRGMRTLFDKGLVQTEQGRAVKDYVYGADRSDTEKYSRIGTAAAPFLFQPELGLGPIIGRAMSSAGGSQGLSLLAHLVHLKGAGPLVRLLHANGLLQPIAQAAAPYVNALGHILGRGVERSAVAGGVGYKAATEAGDTDERREPNGPAERPRPPVPSGGETAGRSGSPSGRDVSPAAERAPSRWEDFDNFRSTEKGRSP